MANRVGIEFFMGDKPSPAITHAIAMSRDNLTEQELDEMIYALKDWLRFNNLLVDPNKP